MQKNAEFKRTRHFCWTLCLSVILVIRIFVAGDDFGGVTKALGYTQRQSIIVHDRGRYRIRNELITNQGIQGIGRNCVKFELILILFVFDQLDFFGGLSLQ